MLGIIKQINEKIKWVFNFLIKLLKKDVIFYILLIIFSSSISFFLGSLSEFQKQRGEEQDSIELLHQKTGKDIYYVASKQGKRYYLPWCYTGKEENQISFKSIEEAKKAGYTPAKNCQGL